MVSFVNFARIAVTCVGFHLGTLHGYFFSQRLLAKFEFPTRISNKTCLNISLAGTDVNRTLVGNLGRNIIRKLVVKLEGDEIISIDDYDILYSYYDCWKCKTERLNAVFQVIVEADGKSENAIKHRINTTDKANNAKDQTVASIYDNGFCIPLDFEIFESSLESRMAQVVV